MCGIAGYVGSRVLERETLESCLRAMSHRGPDASRYAHWETRTGRQVYLLHARLSIIDLDPRSNQPFRVGSGSIVFNGELYNYQELRAPLINAGISFQTQSDTEIFLHHFMRQGPQVLDQFEGMWACGIYDEASETLTLSRDRFGEKPLYVYRDATGLYFGSEVKLLAQLLGKQFKINYTHLYRYLVNGYKSLYKPSDTFFQDVSEVPAGSCLTVQSNGSLTTKPYWQPQFVPNEEIPYTEAVEGVRSRLIRSVELRLRADVPLAFCMSGGVDSNSLISIAKRVFGYDVHGFTIGNTDARYEENDMVNLAVRELNIRHSMVPITTDQFLPNLRKLVRHHDSPVCTITYYAHWLLMQQIAKQGYRISVSGTGADELFTGYYDHHLAYLYEVRNNPELFQRSQSAWETHVASIVRNPFLQRADAFIQTPTMRDHIYLHSDEFASWLKKPWSEPFHEETYTPDLLRNRMLNELFHEIVPPILHEDDLNAMYFSIENRSPFLDRSLFEYANSIPTQHLIRDGYAKAVLRDAMKGIVPTEILTNHRKVGFNAPIQSFLDLNNSETVEALLKDSPVFEHVQRDKIATLIQKPVLPNSESKFLFYFLNVKLFLEEFE